MPYFNSRFWHFVVISTRIFLGLIFFTGGMSKLMPFPGVIGPTWLIERLAEHGLEMYGYFIAYSQVAIGLLGLCPLLYAWTGGWAYGIALLGLACFPASWALERYAVKKATA